MGIGLKILDPRNYKGMLTIAKLSSRLESHLIKHCAYCDQNMGNDLPVIEFVKHLTDKHSDKVPPDEIESYEKLIKKVVG